MTSIDFYFNAEERLQVACRLAGKAVARGKRLVVTFEESVVTGGFGSGVLELVEEARLADAAYRDGVVPAQHQRQMALRDGFGNHALDLCQVLDRCSAESKTLRAHLFGGNGKIAQVGNLLAQSAKGFFKPCQPDGGRPQSCSGALPAKVEWRTDDVDHAQDSSGWSVNSFHAPTCRCPQRPGRL